MVVLGVAGSDWVVGAPSFGTVVDVVVVPETGVVASLPGCVVVLGVAGSDWVVGTPPVGTVVGVVVVGIVVVVGVTVNTITTYCYSNKL